MTYQVDIRSRLNHSVLSFCLAAMLGLSACAGKGGPFDPRQHDLIDRKQDLSREDYRNMPAPKVHVPDEIKDLKPHYEGDIQPKAELGVPPVPKVSEILAAPRPPQIGETQLVSLFVTDDVPLKDVLIELGRLADVDMEIDSSIEGGIVFRAQNRPFNEVMERIAKLADLRYEMRDGVVRVERDTPRAKTYPIDFLSFDRNSTSAVSISTSVLSSSVSGGGGSGSSGSSGGGGGGENESLQTGSTAAINYAAQADFWQQFLAGLQQIVAQPPASRSAAPVAADAEPANQAGQANADSQVIVNRQAGTVTVIAPERVHVMVEDYLRKLRETAGAQVLIEAKIVEVTLDDRYQSGVNWNEVFSSHFLTMDADFNNIDAAAGNVSSIIIGGTDASDPSLDAIIRLTQTFGTTRTLSSPRLHAMNNQQAVLTFAKNLIYFDLSVEREQQVAGDTVLAPLLTVDAEPVTVPVGIIISMQPTINTKTNEVTLSIRPTLSRVIDYVADPSVAFLIAQADDDVSVSNNIPQIEVRELDTLMRMHSGQIMVLGGLMEQIGENQDQGVPFLSSIPWVGNAFKAVNKSERVNELFILVKATIVGNNTNVDPVDVDVYRKFTTDHRPLAF